MLYPRSPASKAVFRSSSSTSKYAVHTGMPVPPPVSTDDVAAEWGEEEQRTLRDFVRSSSHARSLAAVFVRVSTTEPSLSDAEEQAQSEAPEEPLQQASLPVEMPLPRAPIPTV